VQDVQCLRSICKQKITGPKIFFNNLYRPTVELNRGITFSLGETWPPEIFGRKITIVCYGLTNFVKSIHFRFNEDNDFFFSPILAFSVYFHCAFQQLCVFVWKPNTFWYVSAYLPQKNARKRWWKLQYMAIFPALHSKAYVCKMLEVFETVLESLRFYRYFHLL